MQVLSDSYIAAAILMMERPSKELQGLSSSKQLNVIFVMVPGQLILIQRAYSESPLSLSANQLRAD